MFQISQPCSRVRPICKPDSLPQQNLPKKTSQRYNERNEAGCPHCFIQLLILFSERETTTGLKTRVEACRSSFYFVTSIPSSPTSFIVQTTRIVRMLSNCFMSSESWRSAYSEGRVCTSNSTSSAVRVFNHGQCTIRWIPSWPAPHLELQ